MPTSHTTNKKEIIYTKVLCEVREDKDDENCTKTIIGGNLICYPGNAGTNTASLELIKLMLNSVISRKGACVNTALLSQYVHIVTV